MFGPLLGGMGGMEGIPGGAAGGPDMMSFFNNPSLMNMVCFDRKRKNVSLLFYLKAMQFVQNPQVQGL
jgi:hypothetical protein